MLRPDSDRPCCRCKVGKCDNCVCGAAGKTCISCSSTNCQNTLVNIFVIYKISSAQLLAHQWGAYAVPVALSSIVCRVSFVSTITTRNNKDIKSIFVQMFIMFLDCVF